MLTPREFQIAGKILAAQVNLRVKDLAQEYKVSSRTIQYDLEKVKVFFEKQGIQFFSGTKKGIWAECTASQRETARRELNQMQKGEIYFDQPMRTQRILLLLLFNDGYMTAGTIAEKLNVSRGTILSDMDHVSLLLEESGLQLLRQARQGYQLAGAEFSLRTLAENLLKEGMSVYTIYQMINQLKSGEASTSCPLPLDGASAQDYLAVEQAMIQAFQEHPEQLQNENGIALITRTLVSVIRVRMQRYIGSSAKPANPDSHYLYPYWEALYSQYELPVLRDELDYIQGLYQAEKIPVDIATLSAELVKSVSNMEDFPYYQDNTLYPRLLTHLRLNFSSEKKNTDKNPFHDLIISNHARLYKNIKTVCKKYVNQSYLFSNDSFVSYLVLHFLMSQHNLGVGREMRVVFVCATGQGAARIIERMLEAEVRRIEIVQHCSLAEVDEVVETLRPDFIISVFPIKAAIPVLVVEPLPSKADIEAIHKLIDDCTDEDELLYHDQTMNFRVDRDKQEEVTREVILTGLKIYAKLKEEAACKVCPNLEFAFLAHVMLLAERYIFDKQYVCKSDVETALDTLIKNKLMEIGIYLMLDEIKALGYYFDKPQNKETASKNSNTEGRST